MSGAAGEEQGVRKSTRRMARLKLAASIGATASVALLAFGLACAAGGGGHGGGGHGGGGDAAGREAQATVQSSADSAGAVGAVGASATISPAHKARDLKATNQAIKTGETAAVGPVAPVPMALTGEKTIPGGLYGGVTFYAPTAPLSGFVVLYSGREGWSPSDRDTAQALAHNGAMVIGVDLQRYAAKLARNKEDPSGCHYLVGDAEALSHQLQREVHSSRYFLPILAGTGEGALVAERTLGRSPSNTLSGAVMLDPAGTLDRRFNPCAPDATIDRGNGLTGFLVAGSLTGATVKAVIPTGNQALKTQSFAKDTTQKDALLAMIAPHLQVAEEPSNDDVSDLPLVALPAAHPSDMLAIVISGDGGWRDLDKTVAEALQRQGVQVVGMDALRYFWSEKSPAQTTKDIARIIKVYGRRWHTKHVALIGYSFGADVMPFIYNRLPPDLRAQVNLVSLLGFESKADFQIRVTGWLGMPASEQALPVLPETAKMDPSMLQCFYGKEEDGTACPLLVKQGVKITELQGGHHFGGSYDDLAKTILTYWQSRTGR